jgi:hypothetical protein
MYVVNPPLNLRASAAAIIVFALVLTLSAVVPSPSSARVTRVVSLPLGISCSATGLRDTHHEAVPLGPARFAGICDELLRTRTDGRTPVETGVENRGTPTRSHSLHISPSPFPRTISPRAVEMRLNASPVWIIMADSRVPSLHDRLNNASYPTLAAVANLLYARRHGYNFTLFIYSWNHTEAALARLQIPPPPTACYHYGTGLFRHAMWCKILACWHALRSVGRRPWAPQLWSGHSTPAGSRPAAAPAPRTAQWLIFLDSDTFVLNRNMSFSEWASNAPPSISGPSVHDALVSFANDRPYPTGNEPNTGVFFFRPDAPGYNATADFFRFWWEAPDGGKAMERFHEQDSLRAFYRNKEWASKIAVLNNEVWMRYDRGNGQWLRHYTEQKEWHRPSVMRKNLAALGVTPSAFRRLVQDLIKNHVICVDVFDAAKQIQDATG